MGVRILLVVLVVLVAVGGRKTDTAALTITRDNAYTGLIVAIREDLDSSKCDVYVQSIQDMIGYASEILYNATNNKLYFGEVTIVIPWSCTGINIVSNSQWLGWDDAHLRLGPQDPLFKDNPWTQQPRGCGEPGDFIYFSDGFLFSNADMEYQGKLLVHEWAKFRWGVFEEYGHMHDPIYPTAYLTSDNTFGPSYCINAKLTGTLSDGCMQNDKDNCSFTPDLTPDSNTNVTSSLLSVPFLKTVINFCNSTDHDTTVPTKHNLLCDKHSIQEVIDQHDDMKTIPGNTLMNTNFSVVMAPPPGDTIVFVLDYSIIMQNVASRLQFLKDSVSQFIRFKAVPQTRVGLVIFADDVLISKELQLLNTDDNRNSLIQTILLNFSNKQKKNLLPGILQAVKILGNEKGVIVLVTENLEAYQPSPSLIDAAQGYQVWPILYPHDDNIPIQVYQDLADIVPGTPVLTASNIIDTVMILGNLNSYQSVDSYAALSENLLKVGGNSLEKVADGTCSEKVCSVTLAVNDGIQYESNAFIEVLYSMVEVMLVPSPSINISASSYSENLIKFELPILTSKMFAVEHPQIFSEYQLYSGHTTKN
ncbi:calcium-activated chloride channel regulator 2 isoform X2 [Cherax quadricarinatus]|uniref:calcium-activated chloride channel regulator 2 isoform X2 n=1 Tax=Cherax quadricarinatus TaxID=27406 RepID=UPI00387E29BA